MKGYMENETVYSIVNKIAETASNIPFEVVDKNGEVIKDHWAIKLLENPNDDTTGNEIIYNYYVYLLSIGNSFLYGPKLVSGRVRELWTMPSDIVNVVSGAFYEPIAGYKLIEGNQETIFPKEEVLHGKLFNPRFRSGSWVYGLSPISVASTIISAMNSGNTALESSFRNLGPPYIISSQMPEGLSPEQQEMLEDTYKRKYSDANNFGKPMMTGTPVKVEKLGFSPDDLKIIDSSKHGLRVLCNVYGVPSVLFNDSESSTYNNVNQARLDLMSYTIMPLNKQFALKMDKFLGLKDGERLRFDYDNVEVLQEAIYTRAKSLSTMWELTPNERRIAIGYPRINDPLMDEIYKPNGSFTIGTEEEQQLEPTVVNPNDNNLRMNKK
jgi:HK97 family phage portal protein